MNRISTLTPRTNVKMIVSTMIEEEMITKIFLFDTKSLPTFVGTAGAGAAAASAAVGVMAFFSPP